MTDAPVTPRSAFAPITPQKMKLTMFLTTNFGKNCRGRSQ